MCVIQEIRSCLCYPPAERLRATTVLLLPSHEQLFALMPMNHRLTGGGNGGDGLRRQRGWGWRGRQPGPPFRRAAAAEGCGADRLRRSVVPGGTRGAVVWVRFAHQWARVRRDAAVVVSVRLGGRFGATGDDDAGLVEAVDIAERARRRGPLRRGRGGRVAVFGHATRGVSLPRAWSRSSTPMRAQR